MLTVNVPESVDPSTYHPWWSTLTLETTTITVQRFRCVAEPLDLAPLFARRPGAHPERIVAVTGGETTDGKAQVALTYANGWTAHATVRIDEYTERHLRLVVHPPDHHDDIVTDTPYADVARADLELLIGDIGHAVTDPGYMED
jgi:hypothetical protein